MPAVSVGDLDVEYATAGSGKRTVVLVHGNYASSRWWLPTLDRVPDGVAAYAPDLRGCGGTSGDTDDLGIERLARDLEAFVDTLGLQRFHLVGHSLGGAVALELALSRPNRVRSLTLIAPAPADGLAGMREGNSQLARMLRRVDPSNPSTMSMLHSMQSIGRAFGLDRVNLRMAIREMVPAPHETAPAFAELVDDAAHLTPAVTMGFLQALHRFDVTERLRSFHRATLIYGGARDPIVSLPPLERMADALPRATFVTWNDGGHAPMLERPDELAALVYDFTRRNATPIDWRWLWRRFRAALPHRPRRRLLAS